MKKSTVIGLLILVLIFQNCKQPKKQDGLINDNQKNVEQQAIDTTTVINNLDIKEEILTTIESEKIEAIVLKTEATTKPIIKPSKNTEKEVIVVKDIVEEKAIEKVIETEKEIEVVTQPIVEKVIEKEAEIKTVTESIVEKSNTIIVSNKWVVPAKYQKMTNPEEASKDNIAIGKSMYSKHCKSCHGKEGLGDGSKANEIEGDLGDFSSEEFQGQSDGGIYYKSYIGRDDMPSFEKKMSEEDMWLTIHYMRTLAE